MNTSSKRLMVMFGASAFALMAAPTDSFAQAGGAEVGSETIVVTARQRSEELQDVPAQVTAFNAAAIEDRGIERPADFIASVPNVTFVETQNAGTSFLVIRGISQARKIAALAEAHSIPVIPHAGQMHNYHIVMASLNSPMAEFFPPVDVEVGNELFWYIFKGEPTPKDGFIDLDENTPGLGLTVDEVALKKFHISE